MSERAALVRAILDDPADDTTRLVFADWLEENGEPERAEFIRCQIAAARLPEAGLPKSAPAERADALLKEHQVAWRAAVGLGRAEGRYERGFLTGVELFSTEFPARVTQLLSREPAALSLHLQAWHEDESPVTPEEVDDLAADPGLRSVVELRSQGGGYGPDRFARLMRSPHLVNLRAIDLFEDTIGAAGVRAIIAAPAPFTLVSLELNEAFQSPLADETAETREAVGLIATAPRFAALVHLGLPFNGLGDRSVRSLLASAALPRTLHLSLEDNGFDEGEFYDALAERFGVGFDE